MGKVGRLVQAAKFAFRIGDYHVGVRSNSVPVVEEVASFLGSHVVEDPAVPANYSIYEPGPTVDGAPPMYRVYEGCSRILLTPSRSRAVIATVGQLEQFLPEGAVPDGHLRLRTVALIDREAAVLAPHWLPRRFPSLELPLRRRGIRMLSAASVLVDADRGDLLVQSLRSAPGGPTGAAGDLSVGVADPAQPGRRPVLGWFFDTDGRSSSDLTRARAMVRGLTATNERVPDAQSFDLLAKLIRGLDVRERPAGSIVDSAGDMLVRSRRG